MSAPSQQPAAATLDLSRWSKLPERVMIGGAVIALIGLLTNFKLFLYSYLTAFMFFLSLGLGALFLVMLHHLFDAMWTVPIRRFVEHIACLLFPWLFVLSIPIAIFAPMIYPWMGLSPEAAHADHALHAKHHYMNYVAWYGRWLLVFGVWYWLSNGLRKASLKQDETGGADCTRAMRKYSAGGIVLFAFTLTMGVVDWMKSLEHQFFSTMYGVYYFAGSVWTTLATVYLITILLQRAGPLKDVVKTSTILDCGKLFFAFTVFYAYIHFSQYFLIWNAALPEETFWYVKREQGAWEHIGYLLLFGHFFVPFLLLLRIDAKTNLAVMVPICVWAWIMHLCDMGYNVMPALKVNGVAVHANGPSAEAVLYTLGCAAFMAGLLARRFIKSFQAHPPYPQRDPRIAEAMGVYVPPASESHAHGGAK